MPTEQKKASSFTAFWRRLWPREPPETPQQSLRWRPHGNDNFPALVVTQGDLTSCAADAILCPSNTQLALGGGVAAAIQRKSGRALKNDCKSWLRKHERLPVGDAVAMRAGKLPCGHVIFTVGPTVKCDGFQLPSSQQAQELRAAVWNALCEADRLQLTSIAMPPISCGNAGYSADLAAMEIVGECVRFVYEKAESTTLKTIVFMDVDASTCRSFAHELRVAAESYGNGETPEVVVGDILEDTITTERTKADAEPSRNEDGNQDTGVLPARVGANDFEVLVGVGQESGNRCVILLGNERISSFHSNTTSSVPDDQSVLQTACRRFAQDTGGLVSADGVYQAINEASRTLLLKSTTLFIPRLDRQLPGDDREPFMDGDGKSWSPAACDHVQWVSWSSLKIAASAAMISPGEHTVRTSRGDFRLSTCFGSLIEKHGEDVECGLESLLLKSVLQRELQRVDSLRTLQEEELLDEVLGCRWRLHVPSPILPPPPPLEYLSPRDPEYQAFVAQLPRHTASRVVSVRRVHNSAHREEYHKVKSEISAFQTNECVLFHGTIERWRATAIALHGFDLGIRLHGRQYGHGVYTSTDVNVTLSYTSTSGSILKLRGLVATACDDAHNNTIVHGTIHVFPNPKALLPVLIADCAAEGERDTLEKQRRVNPYEYEREEKRRQQIQDAKELDMFKLEVSQRLRVAVDIYTRCLGPRQENTLFQSRPPTRRFFLERRKFALCLPIYEVKPALVTVLSANSIVIVIGDNGSGKSSQLPQLLLDQVLPPCETRRIAILEPRRVNAISLSKLVSRERGHIPGQEVGYTVGNGESNATPGVTRLEYMTHGVFIQMARDPAHLQKIYCAVIVDEAHERSLDVDLSLALLRRILQQRVPALAPCKVVVAGALSEEVTKKWQRQLDSSLLQSAILRIPSRAFPVCIEHSADAEMDETALGTGKADQAVRSAITRLMELFRTAEQGNILVFAPSEDGVREALETTRRAINTSASVHQLDTCGSWSSGFCFRTSIRSRSNGDSQELTWIGTDGGAATTYVVGYHDKITPVELDRVLHPSSSIDRLVVFATSIAETGVAVPNVRYVIDAGLESRVRWNPAFGVDKIAIEKISKTSMIQRALRAGHMAPGICVRLYPENPGDQPTELPTVQSSALVYTTVLLNKELSNRGERPLEMWDPSDLSRVTLVEQRLVALGAVEARNGRVTREGKALLRLGIDLRLGKFLTACAHFGCLATGVKLVSVLMVDDAPEMLLPSRSLHPRTECMHSLIDRGGDHLTLLNIIEAYDSACDKGRGVSWCQEAEVSSDIFIQADAAREKLLNVLDDLDFALVDAPSVRASSKQKKTRIRQALCAAFYDQLARPQVAKPTVTEFVHVSSDGTKYQEQRRAGAFTSGFFARLVASGDFSHKANGVVMNDLLALGDSSTMWVPHVSSALLSSQEWVVFGSCVATSDSTTYKSVVSLLTRVEAEDVRVGAKEVCHLGSQSALDPCSRETFEMDLPGDVARSYRANPAKLLQGLPSELKDSVAATIEHGKLRVTCVSRRQARVEHHLRKYIQTLTPESITIQLPPRANVSALGEQVERLRASIEEFLVSEQCGVGQQHVRSRLLSVDPSRNAVMVTLQGPSKSMMNVVVGRVQSAITEIFGAEMLPMAFDPCDHRIFRLMQLLDSTPPPSRETRDDIVLQIAHTLLWTCGASLHGVFVRDWIVRGESVHNIDVLLHPPLTTAQSVHEGLLKFLVNPHARSMKMATRVKKANGASLALSFRDRSVEPIIVSMVGREEASIPPGVYCDAGNLLLNRNALSKEISSVGGSVMAALQNIQRKQFELYQPLDGEEQDAIAFGKLRQYLQAGWTCLTRVCLAWERKLTPEERARICPSDSD